MKKILGMVLFVLVLGSILTVTLLAVDHYTAPTIEANERIKVRTNVLEALGIPVDDSDVDTVFDRAVDVSEAAGTTLFIAADGSKAIAYEGAGLWGTITGILSVNPDGTALRGVTIIHQEETPGLGGRISEEEYLAGFSGRLLEPPMVVTAPGKASSPEEIDAITGATMTSNAFISILNDHIAAAMPILRGDQ